MLDAVVRNLLYLDELAVNGKYSDRAVLGKRVRELIFDNVITVKFFAPDVAYADVRKYLPALLKKPEVRRAGEAIAQKKFHSACCKVTRDKCDLLRQLDGNRLIILAKGSHYWIYEYLFAKKDRDNIDDAELVMFRMLAKGYEGLTRFQLTKLIEGKLLVEICHDDEKKV